MLNCFFIDIPDTLAIRRSNIPNLTPKIYLACEENSLCEHMLSFRSKLYMSLLVSPDGGVHLVTWICRHTRQGRVVKLDPDNKPVWPTSSTSKLMHFDGYRVAMPSVGTKVLMAQRMNHPEMKPSVLRLRSMLLTLFGAGSSPSCFICEGNVDVGAEALFTCRA